MAREAVIVESLRTGLTKAHRGSFNLTEPVDYTAHCLKAVVDRAVEAGRAEEASVRAELHGRDGLVVNWEGAQFLEGHLERGASPRVEINAAIRLEEIYRTVKQDPERARRVVDLVLERYPTAPKLERFRRQRGVEPGI